VISIHYTISTMILQVKFNALCIKRNVIALTLPNVITHTMYQCKKHSKVAFLPKTKIEFRQLLQVHFHNWLPHKSLNEAPDEVLRGDCQSAHILT